MKQTKETDVEEWLMTLKSASMEVQNVLDEALTEAMIQRSLGKLGIRYKAKAFFSSRHNPLMVKTRIAHKVKNMRKKLDIIDSNRSRFKLIPSNISEDASGSDVEIPSRETSSLVHFLKIYGRDEEKMMMIHTICNQYVGIHDVDVGYVRVYAIWGMGGIGKTTLAQLVYNHETVNTYFELKFWVYVSDVFDIKRIIKSICGGSVDEPLDEMQVRLQKMLRGKKFFIVLDDVWMENKEMKKWDELCKALSCGAKGSTVLVTTRKRTTSQLMAKIPEMQHHLGVLSEKDSWSLFKMLAFPGQRERVNIKVNFEIMSLNDELCHFGQLFDQRVVLFLW